MKLIVLGDIHDRDLFSSGRKQPFQLAVRKFFDWFCKSKYNSPEYILLFLGDLTEKSINQGELNDFFIELFTKRIKTKKILILSGNHDMNREGSNLSTFRSLDNVDIFDEPCSMVIDNTTFLMLPHLQKNMKKTYESLPEEITGLSYDYAFGHLMDETRDFGGGKGIDLSYLNIKQRVFGHDHNFDLDKGGNYLGSVSPNSYTERDSKKYIYEIDTETKEGNYIEVPVFLGYQEVEYPNPLPEKKYKYVIWTVKESLDKGQTIKFYEKECEKSGEEFFYRRIEKKKSKEEKEIEERKAKSEFTSIEDYIKLYRESVGLKESVFEIVKGEISGKSS